MKMNIGTAKIWFRRTRENVSVLQTFAILYLFIDKTGWKWWYPVLLLPFAVFTFFDLKRGQGQEVDYGFGQSKEWRMLHEKLDRIEKLMKRIDEKGGQGQTRRSAPTVAPTGQPQRVSPNESPKVE